jgi:hypothetical protein
VNRIYEKPPEWRTERARNASQASHGIEATAAKLVRDWSASTPEQQRTVQALLGPVVRGSNSS